MAFTMSGDKKLQALWDNAEDSLRFYRLCATRCIDAMNDGKVSLSHFWARCHRAVYELYENVRIRLLMVAKCYYPN